MKRKPTIWVAVQSLGIGGVEKALYDLVTCSCHMINWTIWVNAGTGIHYDTMPDEIRVFSGSIDSLINAIEKEEPDVFVNDIVDQLIDHTAKIAKRVGLMELIVHSPHPWSMKFLDKKLIRYYDRVICVAAYQVEYFVKQGVSRDKIMVLETFIDQQQFYPRQYFDSKISRIKTDGSFIFGFVGRADWDKRVYTMPYIVRLLVDRGIDAKLVLVGLTEPNQGERTVFWDGVVNGIRESASKYKVENRVHEIKPVHDTSEWLSAFDASILPSVHEGSPLFPVESLSCGTPCIATDVGDLKDFLLPCTGSAIIPGQNMIEPLIADELTRIHNATDRQKKEWSNKSVSVIKQLRSKERWIENILPRLRKIFL